MGRVYTANLSEVTFPATNAFDIFELNAPATGMCKILSAHCGQDSDAGDAQAELLPILIARATGSGSGGSTPTASPHHIGAAASGVGIEAANTTIATTLTLLYAGTFNVQAGWFYEPIPDAMLWIPPSGRIVISCPSGPGSAFTSAFSAHVTFEEYD